MNTGSGFNRGKKGDQFNTPFKGKEQKQRKGIKNVTDIKRPLCRVEPSPVFYRKSREGNCGGGEKGAFISVREKGGARYQVQPS